LNDKYDSTNGWCFCSIELLKTLLSTVTPWQSNESKQKPTAYTSSHHCKNIWCMPWCLIWILSLPTHSCPRSNTNKKSDTIDL